MAPRRWKILVSSYRRAGISARMFCRMYPKGTYVIGTGTHAVCVIDGDYYDTGDSGDEIPQYFWKKERG